MRQPRFLFDDSQTIPIGPILRSGHSTGVTMFLEDGELAALLSAGPAATSTQLGLGHMIDISHWQHV